MTLIALTDCCRRLAIDPKTLRRWLAQAQLSLEPHPNDARLKGITGDHLRLLASLHHRSLPALPGELPPLAPTGHPPSPPPLPPELSTLLAQLGALPAQLTALQHQLTALTQALLRPPHASPATAVPAQAGKGTLTRAKASARSRRATVSRTLWPRPAAHVLPLVEYGSDGHYVVLCPKQGVLSLQPETPEWFAYLATLSSFRFVGKCGRLTAHREVERLPRAAWRAHRQIRNHSYNLHLGSTEGLTIAALEQAAATLQAHLS